MGLVLHGRGPKVREAVISEDQRVYSDAEFAVILQKAAELAQSSRSRRSSPTGLTLAEMKAAAAEAGIEPALIERAARLLSESSSKTFYESLIGGPARHGARMQLPAAFDETSAAQLLVSVQILAEEPGIGHSSAAGMVWHAQNEMEGLRITAQPAEGGTTIDVNVDRTGVLALVHVVGMVASVFASIVGVAVADQVAPIAGIATGVGGIGGVLALGRAYWKSSTTQVRDRVHRLLDAIGESATRSSEQHSSSEIDKAD